MNSSKNVSHSDRGPAASGLLLHLPARDLEEVLSATESHWEAMRGKRLLLTGGTGIIGKWLLATFLHANRALNLHAGITVLSRNVGAFLAQHPEVHGAGEIEWIQGDVRDFTLPEGKAHEFVIHAATDVVATQSASHTFDTCVTGTRRVLEQMRSTGGRRMLLLSSGAVYGPAPAGLARFSETWSGAPDQLSTNSAYGEGKRASELMCAIAAAEHGFEIPIARCFAMVGPYLPLDKHFAIGNFIRAAISDRPIEINGDGTPLRSYLYMSDVTSWLWTLLFRGGTRAYNVGGEEPVSISELAVRVATVLGAGSAIRTAKTPVTGALPQPYVPDIARAWLELGLRPTVELDQAIQRTAQWVIRKQA
jgi:dTDP-glucose 4,6-dehydratase